MIAAVCAHGHLLAPTELIRSITLHIQTRSCRISKLRAILNTTTDISNVVPRRRHNNVRLWWKQLQLILYEFRSSSIFTWVLPYIKLLFLPLNFRVQCASFWVSWWNKKAWTKRLFNSIFYWIVLMKTCRPYKHLLLLASTRCKQNADDWVLCVCCKTIAHNDEMHNVHTCLRRYLIS